MGIQDASNVSQPPNADLTHADPEQRMRRLVQNAMWSYSMVFGNASLARVLGDGVRSLYKLTEPLPEHWLELIAKLEGPAEATSRP
jgi:hypothetical protein